HEIGGARRGLFNRWHLDGRRGAGCRLPRSELLFEQRQHRACLDVADDDHGALLWAERGSIERAQIVGREGLDRLGAATRWRAIAVLDAEDDARERRRRDRRRIVAALQE